MKHRAELVSVITRTSNRTVLLKRAIESVLAQTYPHWQMIVVNDGGPREPVERLLAHYAREANGRIEVVHNDASLGMHGASAVGLRRASGDLLAVHDDDDSWAPEFLAVVVPALRNLRQEFPSVRGVTTYCNRVMERVHGNLVHIDKVESFSDGVPAGMLSLDRMLSGNFLPPISFIFERSAFEELDGVYEVIPYLGDWEFLLRFLIRFDIYMVPQHLAFYHWRLGDQAIFGNSVTAEVERHIFYRQVLLNRWLRADLSAGVFGMGAYANLRQHLRTRVTSDADSPPMADHPSSARPTAGGRHDVHRPVASVTATLASHAGSATPVETKGAAWRIRWPKVRNAAWAIAARLTRKGPGPGGTDQG